MYYQTAHHNVWCGYDPHGMDDVIDSGPLGVANGTKGVGVHHVPMVRAGKSVYLEKAHVKVSSFTHGILVGLG